MNNWWWSHNLDFVMSVVAAAAGSGEEGGCRRGGQGWCQVLLLQGGDYTYHLLSQQNHREGILAVYHHLLLKQIYTMTKRVLFLNLMDIKLCVAANGQRLGAALGILATLS